MQKRQHNYDSIYRCWHLISVELPPTLEFIGYQAFNSCIHLKNVSIPKTVTSMEDSVFMIALFYLHRGMIVFFCLSDMKLAIKLLAINVCLFLSEKCKVLLTPITEWLSLCNNNLPLIYLISFHQLPSIPPGPHHPHSLWAEPSSCALGGSAAHNNT